MSLRAKKKGEPPIDVMLPITPMLDMAFQLLAFFIMVYRPAAKEGQEELVLPTAEERQQRAAHRPEDVDPRIKPPPPNPKKPEKKDDELTVVMRYQGTQELDVNRDGQTKKEKVKIYELSLQINEQAPIVYREKQTEEENRKDLQVKLAELFKRQEELIRDKHKAEEDAEVQAKKIKRDLDNFPVRVAPSPQASWGDVVAIRDLCRAAGFRRVVCGDPLTQPQ
jgi:biopolymer transport protein ExbD